MTREFFCIYSHRFSHVGNRSPILQLTIHKVGILRRTIAPALAGKFLFSHGNHNRQHLQIFDWYGLRDSLLSARRQRNPSAKGCRPFKLLIKS
ncbi:MAG: hypothetical protein LBU34_00140 [Planctomycetaceae bacterium]|nr:hypothetical protein [Planctomycetaceae bacterium]